MCVHTCVAYFCFSRCHCRCCKYYWCISVTITFMAQYFPLFLYLYYLIHIMMITTTTIYVYSARRSSWDKSDGSHLRIRHSHLAKTRKREWTDCQIPCVYSYLGSWVGSWDSYSKENCTAIHMELRGDRFEKARGVWSLGNGWDEDWGRSQKLFRLIYSFVYG